MRKGASFPRNWYVTPPKDRPYFDFTYHMQCSFVLYRLFRQIKENIVKINAAQSSTNYAAQTNTKTLNNAWFGGKLLDFNKTPCSTNIQTDESDNENKPLQFKISRRKLINLNTASTPKRELIRKNTGKSKAELGFKAVAPPVKKSFIHLGNLNIIKTDTITEHLNKAGIKCISIFPIAKRSSNVEGDDNKSSTAFRICVANNEVSKMFEEDLWPEHTIIRDWIFNVKPSNTIENNNNNKHG
ncbi:hypothetical protein HELRODRAFT_164988 [Helobdella robusta]|uniref:Uncharacterized protein n=1 Tax=Helobdella robusta TaxID=6412 RepID=T1EW28_HELRO|nr:hypothetical protein HELRODRAFT_164988 [Helobdella robusta]ESN92857.1 hypothetical protein HELRODRAFT_164988 [Helobdella robusta]